MSGRPRSPRGILRRLRLLLIDRFAGEQHANLLWAAALGFAGAVASFGFREAIHALQMLFGEPSTSLVATARSLAPWQRLLLPTVGGLLAGVVLQLTRHLARGKPASDYMEAIAIGDGRIDVPQSAGRSVSSLLTVATGGSIGREGSMVHLAATVASILGRGARTSAPRLRLFVACGAAAGITSAYSAPIAGALFVAEIVLGSIAMESFGPLLVASVVANVTMRAFPGYAAPYRMPPVPDVSGQEVALFAVLGVACGLVAPAFLQLLDGAKAGFRRVPLPLAVRMGIGGLVVGAISVAVPEVWGNGYSVVNEMLHQPWLWTSLLLLLACKIAATAATVGSGAIGGVFTPTLFVGAALGSLFGHAAAAAGVAPYAPPYAFVIVGMGAFLAAATHAPLMAIVMIFEMTLTYSVVLPLTLACVIAYFVARALRERGMYAATARTGRRSRAAAWRTLAVADLVKPVEAWVDERAGLDELERVFLAHPVRYAYVLDDARRFRGAISVHKVKPRLLGRADGADGTLASLMDADFPVLTPDMSLGDALQKFLAFRGERLPVIASAADRRLLGSVSKSDLLLKIGEAAGGH